MQDYEKLGVFYLGREWETREGRAGDRPVLYDSRDLTTHAVCVGMTGSGKTGLCVTLLEEAAIDGVPVIAIDPKGDLAALALQFPALTAEDFRPWIDPAEAARQGLDVGAFAARTAERWREGLAAWGQGPDRIARLRGAADVVVYTPGSEAGVALGILGSLAAPPADARADEEALRDRVAASVSGVLALVGIEADPLRSREHVLLSLLLDRAWRAGRDVDLATLIGEVQQPGIDRVGVVSLESFFPANDRVALAMRMNALVAAPAFAPWLRGQPLDVAAMLFGPGGRPRVSVISIAHLSDAERMFVVTAVLGEVLAWVRRQPGTGSLRAILYMDEVFGFLPPTAEPPSKRPLLTLLKQARAFGLGVVLATQNPVDLDYKALANTGTWFIGRLQTERDRARLLDGLAGAGGFTAERAEIEAQLAALEQRVFLMHDVHEDHPVLFQSRWALSYLRGPLSLAEIRTLPKAAADSAQPPPVDAAKVSPVAHAARPVLEPGVSEVVLEGGRGAVQYVPRLLATARLHYLKGTAVDEWTSVSVLVPVRGDGSEIDWDGATVTSGEPVLAPRVGDGAVFGAVPAALTRAATYRTYAKELTDWLRRTRPLVTWRAPALRARSRPNESEGEFRGRLAHAGREGRDAKVDALRKRYAPKLARAEQAVARAEAKVAREESQYGGQKVQTAISVGATMLGAFFGRRMGRGELGRATTAARHVGRTAREREDVVRAEAEHAKKRGELAELEAAFAADVAALDVPVDPAALDVVEERITLRAGDVQIVRLALAWQPVE